MSLYAERPEWHKDAACRGVGPDRFFLTLAPGATGNSRADRRKIAGALAVCATCQVRPQCWAEGRRLLEEDPRSVHLSVWGGELLSRHELVDVDVAA